jgi:hypothetical protein
MNAKNLVKFLQANGFPEAKLVESEDPQLMDDEIRISEGVSVQVCGEGIYMVGRWTKDDLLKSHQPTKGKFTILTHIKYSVKEEQNESK